MSIYKNFLGFHNVLTFYRSMPHSLKRFIQLLGFTFLLIGVVFWLIRLEIIPSSTWSFLWPSLLLIWGIDLMVLATSQETKETLLEDEIITLTAADTHKWNKKKSKKEKRKH